MTKVFLWTVGAYLLSYALIRGMASSTRIAVISQNRSVLVYHFVPLSEQRAKSPTPGSLPTVSPILVKTDRCLRWVFYPFIWGERELFGNMHGFDFEGEYMANPDDFRH
jgi:hypothetical protein